MDDNLRKKLIKLYNLSERGVGGEKRNAKNFLDKLLQKHGITLEELNEDKKEDRYYKYGRVLTRKLIIQIVYSVIGKEVNAWVCSAYREIGVEATEYEHIQIKELIDFHLENYKKEEKKIINTFYDAYINKHNIFPEKGKEMDKDESEKEEKDWEYIKKVLALKDTIEGETFTKKIKAKN